MVTFDEDKQNRKLEELHFQEAEGLSQMLSKRYGIPYIDLTKTTINSDALRLVPEDMAKAANLATFKIVGRNVDMAILTPNESQVNMIIDDLKNKNFVVRLYLASPNSLEQAWERYKEISFTEASEKGVVEISDRHISQYIQEFITLEDIKDAITQANKDILEGGAVSTILEMILSGALTTLASDIHIEPEEKEVRLRYRLDGVLHDIVDIDHRIYHSLISRLKLVSGMKLNVKQAAQDGRFSIKVEGAEIEIRSSVIPGSYGESIVMRILNPKSINVSFESLGVDNDLLAIFEREINKPNGLVLLTGPTGSGKTTTLYSFLRKVNSPELKIITIEDPIEYHLEGINQTQVNRVKGYTFLSGLRAALRQDPDIIMVGEIRDAETAKIAINSALTGHLVFSTLHTNNAVGAIPRLIDLGASPKIIPSALTLSIAQRLVRKLCVECKKEDLPNADEKDIITKTIATIQLKKPTITIPQTEKVWRSVGCKACGGTGYKGRVGLYEAIYIDEAISKMIIENPSERELKKAAIPQGIFDLRQDGIMKVLQSITDMNELSRIVDLHEEFI